MKIMFKGLLYESRNHTSVQELVNKYSSDPDTYISFRSIDKIGINPNNIYNTPIGIYTYNISLSSEEIFPFPYVGGGGPKKGESTYVYVIKPKEGAIKLDLANYSSEDYVRDLSKLKDLNLIDNREVEYRRRFITESEEIDYDELEKMLNETKPVIKKHYVKIGRLLWNTVKSISKSTTNWNTILRNLGYDYVLDSGYGIIYETERQQCVFLNPRSYIVIDRTVIS